MLYVDTGLTEYTPLSERVPKTATEVPNSQDLEINLPLKFLIGAPANLKVAFDPADLVPCVVLSCSSESPAVNQLPEYWILES